MGECSVGSQCGRRKLSRRAAKRDERAAHFKTAKSSQENARKRRNLSHLAAVATRKQQRRPSGPGGACPKTADPRLDQVVTTRAHPCSAEPRHLHGPVKVSLVVVHGTRPAEVLFVFHSAERCVYRKSRPLDNREGSLKDSNISTTCLAIFQK